LLRGQDREAGRTPEGCRVREGPFRLRPHRGRPRHRTRFGRGHCHCHREGRLQGRSHGLLRPAGPCGARTHLCSFQPAGPPAPDPERSYPKVNRLQKWVHGNWSVPVISGVLIIISFALRWLDGDAGDLTVGRQWWLDAGAHATHAGGVFTLGDVLMIAAAVVAGYGIAVKAVRALIAKVIGIDLLVSVAAIGAVIIGNFWEAAAVTFLFAVGHALEAATLNKTRSALAELVAVAP